MSRSSPLLCDIHWSTGRSRLNEDIGSSTCVQKPEHSAGVDVRGGRKLVCNGGASFEPQKEGGLRWVGSPPPEEDANPKDFSHFKAQSISNFSGRHPCHVRIVAGSLRLQVWSQELRTLSGCGPRAPGTLDEDRHWEEVTPSNQILPPSLPPTVTSRHRASGLQTPSHVCPHDRTWSRVGPSSPTCPPNHPHVRTCC